MLKKVIFIFAVIFGVFTAFTASTCSVPVFRYALERWQPDPYTVRVFYRNELDKDQQRAVDFLKKYSEYGGPIFLEIIDLTKEIPSNAAPVIDRYKDRQLPLVVATYPLYSRIPDDAAVFPLTLKNAEMLMQSPARTELAARLIKGDAAVFIQVDGDNDEENTQTAEKVRSILAGMEKELKLPHQILEEGEKLDERDMPYDPDLKIKFSLLRVSRKTPEEKLFLEIFLNCEKNLQCRNSPIIMPVFGRGRALFAYLGGGITKENIFEAGEYLVGPCTSRSQTQTPGFDVLMATDWDQLLKAGSSIAQAGTSQPAPAAQAEPVKPIEIPREDTDSKASGIEEKLDDKQLPTHIFMTVASLVIIAFIVMKLINRRK